MASKREAIAKAERAFKLFDKDNDGFITKDEFQKISKKLSREQIEAVFSKFDKDGDGVLSFDEFRKMLNKEKWGKFTRTYGRSVGRSDRIKYSIILIIRMAASAAVEKEEKDGNGKCLLGIASRSC